MTPDRSETFKLLREETARERRERRNADDADQPTDQRAALRRADKAAYLKEKLREREASER
jgi:hypothetical protein